jgi:hypothetical protein
MVPQFNQVSEALRAGGLADTQVVAVDVSSEFYALRAGGISVMGVPHVVIKTLHGGIIDYNGPRMADAIAQEAARVLNGGETQLLNGGAQEDALLGGSSPAVQTPVTGGAVPAAAPAALEGGKKRRRKSKSRSRSRRHRKMHGGDAVEGGAADLEGGKRRRKSKSRSRSRRHRKMYGGEAVEGGAAPAAAAAPIEGGAVAVAAPAAGLEGGKRRRKSKSRSRSRRRRMHGGDAVEGGATPAAIEGGADLEGGKRRRRKSKSRSRSRRHRKMHGGEVAPVDVKGGAVSADASPAPVIQGGAAPVVDAAAGLEGGKRRRKSKSRSRSRRRRMHGGDAVEGGATPAAIEGGADLEGGKRRRRKSKSRSRRRRMHGGDAVEGGAVEATPAIEGGKRRKSRSRSRSKRRSMTKWMKLVMTLWNSGRYSSYKSAMKAAKQQYHG